MTDPSVESLSLLVEPNRVHRSIYADPAIFELELERIFGRAWIYVGHESQVPNPGDYVTTLIGRQPVILVRHNDGSMRVLYNRCAHRGAKLVPAPSSGSVRFFRCSYHGWTFRTDGQVLSVPLRHGYDDTPFDANNPAYWVARAARVESYRGFVFATLAPHGPGLSTWLGGIAGSLDDLVDRAPKGRVEVVGRPFRVLQRNNWKLFFENLNDAMHAMVVHESSIDVAREYVPRFSEMEPKPYASDVLPTLEKNGIPYSVWEKMGAAVYKYGHSFIDGFFNPNLDDYSPEYLTAMDKAYGAERMKEILGVNRHNAIIYPCCSTQAAYQQLRVIRPLAVDRTMVEIYNFRLVGAPPDTYRRTLLFTNITNSPSSLVMPDDLEAYNRVQEGLTTQASDWISFDRNFGHDRRSNGYATAIATSELPMRNQHRAWLDYMTAEA